MSNFGFVYLLDNECMPGLIKIGCTERSPRIRAEELSNHTGVPKSFRVLCFAEFENFQQVERNIHKWCSEFRVSQNREFFEGCTDYAARILYFHPDRLSFTDCTAERDYHGPSTLDEICCEDCDGIHFLRDLFNPFKPITLNPTQASIDAGMCCFVEEIPPEIRFNSIGPLE